jgi:hypothetical protein
VDVDPLASMRCWAITVELGGREFEIPALPAADWWPVITDATPSGLLDLLKSESEEDETELDMMLLDGRLTGAELGDVFTDVVGEATGRSFHAAFVLATVAAMHWPVIGGEMAKRGFLWDRQPIGAALDAIYAVIVGGLEKENQEKFLALLENETLTRGGKRQPSQRVMDEFESMAGARPAPAPVPGKASAELSGNRRPKTRPRPRPTPQRGRSGEPTSQP